MRKLLLLATCLTAIPTLASAQEVEELIVTATRTETEAQAIPARVEVIDRAEIEDRVLVTTVEALRTVPGVNIVQSGGPGALTSVFVRGSNSKHVLALFDGVRLNDMSNPNGLYNFGQDTTGDLERIEVARGAYSSVYGSDAIGGVVNFIPRVGATEAFSPYFEAMAGSRETWRALLGARGTTGPVSYAVTADRFVTDGFNNTPARYPDDLRDKDAAEISTVTGVADIKLSDLVTIRALGRVREAKVEIDEPALDRLTRDGEDRYALWRIGPRFTLLDGRLKSDLEAGQLRVKREDRDSADVNEMFPDPNQLSKGLRHFANWRNEYRLNDAVTLSGGLEWRSERIVQIGGYYNDIAREEETKAAYMVAQAELAERFDLTGSVRHDRTDGFDAVTTWNLGAVVRLPEIGGRAFASVGTSFKAPTLHERFASSFFVNPNPDLVPEEGESWEAGFDAGFGWLKGGATYFDSQIENLIVMTFDPFFTGQNVNIDVADIHGHEVWLEAAPVAFLTARVDYTYTDARDGETGARLLRRPAHVWSAQLEARPTEAVRLGLEWRRQGRRVDVLYSDEASPWGPGGSFVGNGVAEAYEVFDATASWRFHERLTAFGAVRNLADETYEEPSGYAGEPRTVLIGIRMSR